MSMSKFATYAEYAASVPAIDKTATLDRISAMAAEAAAEAQLANDAARYRWLLARFIGVDFNWGEPSTNILAFEIGNDFRCSRDISASIDEAMAAQ